MSGLTSQPALGSIVSIMKQNHQDPKLDEEAIRTLSLYWEQVRQNYHALKLILKAEVLMCIFTKCLVVSLRI